ncbi:MAG: hypothetical protein VX127_00780 [Myxococcota bacterium]|nr:hypothetical protein [Myxococcota bacterium]
MNASHLTLCTGLLFGTPALADSTGSPEAEPTAPTVAPTDPETAMWDGVYTRSGKTIKAGEWMGIGGAVVMVGGVVALGSGLSQAFGGGVGALAGNEESSNDVESGIRTSGFGLAATVFGFASYATGPALMAGGSVRQAKAIRKINPEAPRAWYGYASWALWLTGAGSPNLGGQVTSAAFSYVAAGMQKGKNRMQWDRATAQRLAANQPPRVTVDLTPFEYNGNRGLALVGTF